jgi:hypothetical protein
MASLSWPKPSLLRKAQARQIGEIIADRRSTEHYVDVVSDLAILQRESMGVVPQRRRRIAMNEPVLGPENLAPADQAGGDGVAQAMEADTDEVCLRAQLGEPVAQGAGRQAALVVDVR